MAIKKCCCIKDPVIVGPIVYDPKHVHEVQGSVIVNGCGQCLHSHRCCTVTSEAIPVRNSTLNDHYHNIKFRTDFYQDHYHEFSGRTSGAIRVGDRHIHYLESITTAADGHQHRFRLNTLIENPTGRMGS